MLKPGQPQAREIGCTCPAEQNQGGQGTNLVVGTDPSETHFLIAEACSVHGKTNWRDKQ